MGKSKDIAAKEIMPSNIRGGTNLPSRPYISPANATPNVKMKSTDLHSSPLSKMSMPTDNDNELLDDSMDDKVTHDSSNPSSNKFFEPDREIAKANAFKSLPPDCIAAFGRAFMEADLDDLDRFDSLIHAFMEAYEFSVNTKAIEWVEKRKLCGGDDEYLAENMGLLHEIYNLYGNDKLQKHYYFLKLFPFSLGDDAKTWYHSLPSKSITSKNSFVQLFYNKFFPVATIHAMKIDICNFTQRKEEPIPQAWGRFSHMARNCSVHDLKDNEFLDTFYNGLAEKSWSYIDSITCNIFKNQIIGEAKGLLVR
jgi:hypothetical protein